jgi:hypothetical protein
MTAQPPRPVYLLRLKSIQDIRKLRWLLKALLRLYGLCCISVEQEPRP